ncbi:hypothetical protein ACLMJK_004121 [Lecanora helva]
MPRANLPPTPAASAEIQGKDGATLSATEKAFNLGPPAIAPKQNEATESSTKQSHSTAHSTFTLPPPPTRSRTIIQMKPKSQSSEAAHRNSVQPSSKATSKKTTSGSATSNATGKKQPSATSAAGKRIARKTAHSVIERRRRSKMNEEFATLKGMIPACTDQEMHKLAILQQQAGIDYLRYLEKCIADLKVANNSLSTPLIQPQAPPPRLDTTRLGDDESDEDEEDDEDVTMGGTPANGITSPTFPPAQTHNGSYRSPESINPSPALEPQSQPQTSSYRSSGSSLPSPAFGPRGHHSQSSQSHCSLSASTSPTIMPSPEQDQEATAALLMLNKDRRNPKGVRGMSVKDLLSS